MARSGNSLGSAIWTAIKASQTYNPALSSAADAAGLALWQAFGNAFYTYDSANTIVTSTIPADSIVTAGSATTQDGPAAPVNISGGLS